LRWIVLGVLLGIPQLIYVMASEAPWWVYFAVAWPTSVTAGFFAKWNAENPE
jgi:hypothetical protein